MLYDQWIHSHVLLFCPWEETGWSYGGKHVVPYHWSDLLSLLKILKYPKNRKALTQISNWLLTSAQDTIAALNSISDRKEFRKEHVYDLTVVRSGHRNWNRWDSSKAKPKARTSSECVLLYRNGEKDPSVLCNKRQMLYFYPEKRLNF